MKEPDDSHSYSCNQSDLHKIQQISMSETRNLDILQQNPPRVVIINNSIKKCAGCKKLFGKRKGHHQMIWYFISMLDKVDIMRKANWFQGMHLNQHTTVQKTLIASECRGNQSRRMTYIVVATFTLHA